jgi:outer membrane immunogenic protein
VKRLLLVGIAFAGLGGAPVLAAPPAAPMFNWSGFYLGGDLGGAWTSNTGAWLPLPSPAAFSVNPISGRNGGSALFGGIHAGYNWQIAPVWVTGLEGDLSWSRAGSSFTQVWTNFGTTTPFPGDFTTMSSKLDWVSSIRGRVGYLLTPALMAYASGGAAWARIAYAATATNPGVYLATTAFSSTQLGFVVGGGLEWAATDHWILRAEYLYYRFGQAPNLVVQAPAAPAFPSGFSWSATSLNVVRGSLSYKF